MLNHTPHTFVGSTTFRVQGMTCGHCARAVTREVGEVSGITRVDVDLASGLVTVSASAPVDRADVGAAVAEAGYVLVP